MISGCPPSSCRLYAMLPAQPPYSRRISGTRKATLRMCICSGRMGAVAEYLTEFGIQTGIKTTFSYRVDGNLNLSSVAEVQLVCILQEALTNVRKHAQAEQV